MTDSNRLVFIVCPYCGGSDDTFWAEELGFKVVRCKGCSLLYVNPRLPLGEIERAVRSGMHGDEGHGLQVTARRVRSKVRRYEQVLGRFFEDVWAAGQGVSWLDVGAGYGEVLEAVQHLAPSGSRVEGLEPMHPKAEAARGRGLIVTEDYLRASHPRVQIISFIDVFSHLPDFRSFLSDVRAVLRPRGELFMETGNLADVASRDEFSGELGLPDHLVFAGESHLRGFLDAAGFEIVRLERDRVDGVLNFAKCIAKKALGRSEILRVPYTSNYRQLLVRARLKDN
jgi:SAM-dependent methyltransferase